MLLLIRFGIESNINTMLATNILELVLIKLTITILSLLILVVREGGGFPPRWRYSTPDAPGSDPFPRYATDGPSLSHVFSKGFEEYFYENT